MEVHVADRFTDAARIIFARRKVTRVESWQVRGYRQ